ncbi:MAG: dienelactone hydrolase family protein [Acidobacteria bacterium]|nr:dienelactone hydrolase family protein [Acidobacteriota bacterium]
MQPHSIERETSLVGEYDPFVRGLFPVGVRTIQALDSARNRLFPCEIWYPATARHAGQDLATETQDTFPLPQINIPRIQSAVRDAGAQPGAFPLILYSHAGGGHRRAATFLCTHLTSHGYVVAALDHSETLSQELARRESETEEQKTRRWEVVISNRVPDARFLLDSLLSQGTELNLDPNRIGIVGHSFGGWTALALPDVDERIQAVVALAPGGASNPKPGILPLTLAFDWGRDVPTLYLVAENDVSLPLAGMYELFDRTPAPKQMVILRRADHLHFMDHVEEIHEAVRKMSFPGELAWLPKEMQPITELCSGDEAHLFVRGLTLAHLDARLNRNEAAQRFLLSDLEVDFAQRGITVMVHQTNSFQSGKTKEETL